ncbi:MAG: ATP-binding SpoIIE family protein phosphatase [Acidimicrobiales bacterium]
MLRQEADYPAEPESEARARRDAAAAATRWGVDADDLELVVSELVSNAIVHAHGDLRLTLRFVRDTLTVEVADHSSDLPVPSRPGESDQRGRGLLIVGKVAREWGVRLGPHGKIVWADLAARRFSNSAVEPDSGGEEAEQSAATQVAEHPTSTGNRGTTTRVRRTRLLPRVRTPTVFVAVLGLAVTIVLTILARANYAHTEQRLTTLQTSLTGQLLETAPLQIESTLDRVAGLSAESSDPVTTFEASMAPSMQPRGRFVSSSLTLVTPEGPRVIAHLGAASIRDPQGTVATGLYERTASSSSLVTTRAVSQGVQRLGYLVSARGPAGIYVVGAAQQLPAGSHIAVPASSPDAQLNVAIYYGKSVNANNLIATNAPSLPLSGSTSTVTESFGSGWLTLVAAPRSPLSGRLPENLPWAILAAGLALTAAAAVIAEWLGRRRSLAEAAAGESRQMYRQQRDIAEALQGALLPRQMPSPPGVDIAARYIPATQSIDVGGDWYSVIRASPERFVFVVGDVSGHGVSAATSMAPLRFTIRALAKLGMEPAEILERAADEIDISDGHFATVLVGMVDLATESVTLASAGHLPPLFVSHLGSRYLDLLTGPPLGLDRDSYEAKTFEFPAGATLIAFTDGLIERRGTDIQERMDFLAAAARGLEGDSDAYMAGILGELPGVDHEDDVALLVIRRPDSSINVHADDLAGARASEAQV